MGDTSSERREQAIRGAVSAPQNQSSFMAEVRITKGARLQRRAKNYGRSYGDIASTSFTRQGRLDHQQNFIYETQRETVTVGLGNYTIVRKDQSLQQIVYTDIE